MDGVYGYSELEPHSIEVREDLLGDELMMREGVKASSMGWYGGAKATRRVDKGRRKVCVKLAVP